MDSFIAKRAGLTPEQYKAKTTQELWLDAEDALEGKFIDSIVRLENIPAESTKLPINNLKQHINLKN